MIDKRLAALERRQAELDQVRGRIAWMNFRYRLAVMAKDELDRLIDDVLAGQIPDWVPGGYHVTFNK